VDPKAVVSIATKGLAASGKSSVARLLGENYRLLSVGTGDHYRILSFVLYSKMALKTLNKKPECKQFEHIRLECNSMVRRWISR
jgi:cytidylate kinase